MLKGFASPYGVFISSGDLLFQGPHPAESNQEHLVWGRYIKRTKSLITPQNYSGLSIRGDNENKHLPHLHHGPEFGLLFLGKTCLIEAGFLSWKHPGRLQRSSHLTTPTPSHRQLLTSREKTDCKFFTPYKTHLLLLLYPLVMRFYTSMHIVFNQRQIQ